MHEVFVESLAAILTATVCLAAGLWFQERVLFGEKRRHRHG